MATDSILCSRCTPVSLGPSVCCLCPRTAFNIIYFYISIFLYIYFSSLAVHITNGPSTAQHPPSTHPQPLEEVHFTVAGGPYSPTHPLPLPLPLPLPHSPALSLNRRGITESSPLLFSTLFHVRPKSLVFLFRSSFSLLLLSLRG